MSISRKRSALFGVLVLLACGAALPAFAQQADPPPDPSQMPSSQTTAPATEAGPQPSELEEQQTEQQQTQNPGGG
jgi:hypothetical protein